MIKELLIVLAVETLVGAIVLSICLKLIQKQKRTITAYENQVTTLQVRNDELKIRIQIMEEANAQANAITTTDAAVAELSKPRAKRNRKSTGN
jgi:hypothetical protein